jgi:hypothetical protein
LLPGSTATPTPPKPTVFSKPNKWQLCLIVNKEGCLDIGLLSCGNRLLFLPNSHPNDDGLNDVFEPVGNGIHSYHLKIYNSSTGFFRQQQPTLEWSIQKL